MTNIKNILKNVEQKWRAHVTDYFPLWANIPIHITHNTTNKDWIFSTNLKEIFVDINENNSIMNKFETTIKNYWDSDTTILLTDTLHYLLWHELYHPLEAPYSTEDSKKIHQAMRRGIVSAEPELSAAKQLAKVMMAQNCIKDFIIDNKFYLDNYSHKFVQEDIIPIWDLLEIHEEKPQCTLYTITRLLYGVLYGPKSVYKLFSEKSGPLGPTIARKALAALLDHPVKLPKECLTNKEKKIAYKLQQEVSDSVIHSYRIKIREIFSGHLRYDGIESFMSVLGPFIIYDHSPSQHPSIHDTSSTINPSNILQDFLDNMTTQEQIRFMYNLEIEGTAPLHDLHNTLQYSSETKKATQKEILDNINLYMFHEFYKRNHAQIQITSGKQIGTNIHRGNKQYWSLKQSSLVSAQDLHKINLKELEILQKKSGLPWITQLQHGIYRINQYEIKEKPVQDIVYKDDSINMPDIIEFYLDSSGSMFNKKKFIPLNGSRWDMLCKVLYGLIDGLEQAGKQVNKFPMVRFHNFAEQQISSPILTLSKFLQGDFQTIKLLYNPQNGYRFENLDIEKFKDIYQKRVYMIVTDGNLIMKNRSEREGNKMIQLVQQPDTCVALFEIGKTYALGNYISQYPAIKYVQVHNMEEILHYGIKVILE